MKTTKHSLNTKEMELVKLLIANCENTGDALEYAFQDYPLRGVWEVFGYVFHPDPVFLAAVFVECDFLPVAPETVHLPNDD